jgi:5'-nucleotidase
MKRLIPLLALGLASCAATHDGRQPNAVTRAGSLTVIATTDFHGALEAEETRLSGGRQISIGGPALLASYLNTLKAKINGPVVYVDAGDLFQGTMASNLYEGEPVMRFYNYLKPDAAALGNHEFDYGPVGPKAVPRGSGDDPRGALKARIAEAKFPILGINVVDESGKMPSYIRGSLVKETGGVRVGIIGAADEQTPHTTNKLNLTGLRFLDPVEPVRKEAERLRKEEGVSAVVLVIHVGAGCDDNALDRQDDLSSCKIKDIFELVKKLPDGLVDVVVSGHTHRGVAKRIGRTVILQPYSHGKYLGWATVPLTAGGAKPEVTGLAPVCTEVVDSAKGETCDPFVVRDSKNPVKAARFLGNGMTPDPKVEELLRGDLAKVAKLKAEPLGSDVADDFLRSYASESALGNLMADVARETSAGADVGLVNAGGVRANLSPGPLTYGHVYNVFPFDNQLAVMEVTGATLVKMAELGIDGNRGVYLWSGNLKLEADGCQIKRATIDGKELSPAKYYKVATNDYLASTFAALKIPEDKITIYWDADYIVRDLSAGVFRRWKKTLRSIDYYNPQAPRIAGLGQCNPSGGTKR